MSKNWAVAGASAIVVATGMSVAPAYAGHYMAGDMHNHTTCNDGNWSVQTMVTAALGTYGLDWLGDVGHGGAFVRDCRFDDFEGDGSKTGQGAYFENTVGLGAFKGDVANSTSNSGSPATSHRAMWEWQIIQDYHYPLTVKVAKSLGNTVVFKGTEWNTPGHEHTDTTTLFGQTPWKKNNGGNALTAAEFEYRFDRSDGDTSGGAPDHNWTGKDTVNNSGTNGHGIKSLSAINWMQSNYPLGSIALPTHLERAGVFNPAGNGGWNVEHLRDWNNAGPVVAFGMESMPGHQAASARGEYRAGFCGAGCDSVGVTTYGGAGIYAAKIGGVWDALLGEGRNFFTFASSDFHQRGLFKASERGSTADFFPGEYEKTYVPAKPKANFRPQDVLDGLRSGNAYYMQGDLIGPDMTYTANVVGKNVTKTMGQTLVVPRGKDVTITLTVTDPAGANNSPYTFPNPSLAQIGISQPLNNPVLDHVDFIGGNITGVIAPGSANYTNGTNPSAQVIASFDASTWSAAGPLRTMTFTIHNVQNSQYVRVRGTNMPVNTPNETDAAGNPLSDPLNTNAVIPCADPACPAHMTGGKSTFDVAAWSDLWFYANPIFIRVQGDAPLLAETNAELAKSLQVAHSN
jgi:hypothetical protein